MVGHLASLSEKRLILSFAPSTPYYLILKRIGEFFPKGSKVITLARQQKGSLGITMHLSRAIGGK